MAIEKVRAGARGHRVGVGKLLPEISGRGWCGHSACRIATSDRMRGSGHSSPSLVPDVRPAPRGAGWGAWVQDWRELSLRGGPVSVHLGAHGQRDLKGHTIGRADVNARERQDGAR